MNGGKTDTIGIRFIERGTIMNDIYYELYKRMCASCPNARKCHEECVECDEYQDELERLEKENK